MCIYCAYIIGYCVYAGFFFLSHQHYDENKARNLKVQNVVCPQTRATTNMTMLV